MAKRISKKHSRSNSSKSEERISKILEELNRPKPPLRVIGYFIDENGDKKDIGFLE